MPEHRFLIKSRLFARITVKNPRFLPFWVVGLGVLVLYVTGVVVIVTVDRFLPALPHSAELGEASALVGSFLTVISTFFLLYTIHLPPCHASTERECHGRQASDENGRRIETVTRRRSPLV
jgi:hypothetical protein